MTKDEALALALDALENELAVDMTNLDEIDKAAQQMLEAIWAIKQALAAPVQEPVAWIDMRIWPPIRFPEGTLRCHLEHLDGLPLYTTPPAAQRQWVGLTTDEIKHMPELFVIPPHHVEMVVQAIEAKLKEKNT